MSKVESATRLRANFGEVPLEPRPLMAPLPYLASMLDLEAVDVSFRSQSGRSCLKGFTVHNDLVNILGC